MVLRILDVHFAGLSKIPVSILRGVFYIMPAFLWSKLKNAKNRLTVCLRCLENVSDFLLSELLTLGYC